MVSPPSTCARIGFNKARAPLGEPVSRRSRSGSGRLSAISPSTRCKSASQNAPPIARQRRKLLGALRRRLPDRPPRGQPRQGATRSASHTSKNLTGSRRRARRGSPQWFFRLAGARRRWRRANNCLEYAIAPLFFRRNGRRVRRSGIGGFEITKHDLWKRHGGKGALRHGGTVSIYDSEHACSRNRAASSTRPARRLWPTTSAVRIAAIFRASVIALSSTALLGIKTCCDYSVSV